MSEAIRAVMSSVERTGAWTVPPELDVKVRFGNAELDLCDAQLQPGTTTIRVDIRFGNLELFVPESMPVEVNVASFAATVSGGGVTRAEQEAPRVRVVGSVKAGNCEVITLTPGESREHAMERARRSHHQRRWKHVHAERELWHREHGRQRWMPWWLMARMRRRMFTWFALLFAAGISVGVYGWDHARWWHLVGAFVVLSIVSGAVAWRMTRPLIAAIKAASDIGDGKLDTRLEVPPHRGEMRILASALNDMARKIQQQISDQRQLLAAVSHELRTPLGHMRVLIDTARDTNDPKTLDELEREILTLDDLVGRLLAQSRLEFGNLERRSVDVGELVTTAASGVEVVADGDLQASVDPTLMRRAVANLIDNARVHGGGAVSVRVERRGPQIAVEVDDAGPGVPADRRADAFRAFVPSSGGGLGLGLALVSRIAVAHGGGAWIADRPGGGARVGFTVQAT